jgi:5-methylcytosine-specific restriction enzyme A
LCHSIKTGKDVAVKSIDARVRAKHIGLTTKRAKIQSAGFRKAPPQKSASRPIERRS